MKLNHLLVIGILASSIAACSTDHPPVQPPVQEVITINVTSYYNSIWFDNNSSVVSSDFDSIMSLNADFLKSNPMSIIQVQGNASEIGTKEANQKLSIARAKSVASKLIALGVNPSQIQQVSFGAGKPTYPSDKKGHSPQNRRVDLVYISGAPISYYIDKVPVVSTENENTEFDPISVKEQKQKYKNSMPSNASAPVANNSNIATSNSTNAPVSPPPAMVNPAPADQTPADSTSISALPADQSM